jgi:hypothetical protein
MTDQCSATTTVKLLLDKEATVRCVLERQHPGNHWAGNEEVRDGCHVRATWRQEEEP